MKTATITWITYNNYGTMLQAYALQSYIKELGYSNDIISDYKIIVPDISNINNVIENVIENKENSTEKKKRRINEFLSNPFKYFIHVFKVIIRSINNIVNKHKFLKTQKTNKNFYDSQNLFKEFKEKFLEVKNGYSSENLFPLNDMYDAFICGSDQIWSVFDINFNGYFYLDFAKKRKIAYAPSIGTTIIPCSKQDLIKNYVSDFDFISVREKETAVQLEKLTNKKVEWVCDPTLLYDSIFWSKFCEDIIINKRKYLLCYFLEDKEWYFDYARRLAKFLKLKIVLIPSKIQFMNRKEIYDCPVGPKEFVALIRHSEFVLTDSYHGSIFSFIFNKRIIYLKRFDDNDKLNQNIRIDSLFGLLNLESIIVSHKSFEKTDIKNIDYDYIQETLIKFRNKSRIYLESGLNVK